MVNADFSWFALFLAGLSTVTAYHAPVGNPSGNAIILPSLNQQVPVGKPFTITWDPTTKGTVSILLERGPSTDIKPLYHIAQGIANSGKFEWTPSTELEDDVTHYGLQMIDDATGQYQWSTQFGVSNPGYASHSAPSVTSTRLVYVVSAHSTSTSTSHAASSSKPCTTLTTSSTKSSHSASASSSWSKKPRPSYPAGNTTVYPTGSVTSAFYTATTVVIATPSASSPSSTTVEPFQATGGAASVRAAGAIVGMAVAVAFAL